MSDRLDYPAFYELVTELVSSSATSTLFGRTDTNHSVIIGLDGGTIVCVRCGPKRGLAAIHALRSMQWGTFRVDDALVELSSPTLPPTAELVAALHPGATVFEDTPGDDSADPAQQSDNHSAEAKLLCDLLSRYVGPVAPVLCSEEIKAVGGLDHLGKLDLVLGKLAREIDDAGEASEFVLLAQRELAHRFAPAVDRARGHRHTTVEGVARSDPGGQGSLRTGQRLSRSCRRDPLPGEDCRSRWTERPTRVGLGHPAPGSRDRRTARSRAIPQPRACAFRCRHDLTSCLGRHAAGRQPLRLSRCGPSLAALAHPFHQLRETPSQQFH